jgi:hypothetical protein
MSEAVDLAVGSSTRRNFPGVCCYPWSALNTFPILQKLVLINPLVCASEGLRAALVPQSPPLFDRCHLAEAADLRCCAAMDWPAAVS